MLVDSGNGSKKILEFSMKGRVGGLGGGLTHPNPKKVKKVGLKWLILA